MPTGKLKSLFIIFLAIIILFAAILTINNRADKLSKSLENNNSTYEIAEVTGIIDGDTFFISSGDKVRLICIDAPEFGDPGYWEARRFLEDKIKGKNVTLIKDFSEKDAYDRLLRYVYFNETLINELMAREGLASAYPYGVDTTLCPRIKEAEDYAKNKSLGILNLTNNSR